MIFLKLILMNYRFFNKFVLYWHKNVDKWAANAPLI